MTVTEIVTMLIRDGLDITDQSTPAGQTWERTSRLISDQDGFQSYIWGAELESPDTMQLFVNWDTIDSHMAFMKKPQYGPMLQDLGTILAGAPAPYHFEFTSPKGLKAATSAPVTEVATFYLESKSSSFESNIAKFEKAIGDGSVEGFLGTSSGWGAEDVEHDKLGAGNKGKALVLVVGWQSKDAHMAYRETEHFKNNVALLRDGPKHIEMHHVTFAFKSGD
ncbi:hypothetical protein MBLNU459_g2055t1 [Dothideomycetes sp. NU459]